MEQGKGSKKPIFKRWWFWLIVAFLVIGAVGSVTGGGQEQGDVSSPPSETGQPSPDEGGDPPASPESEAPSEGEVPEADGGFVLDVTTLTDADVGPLDTGDLSLLHGELEGVNYGGDGVVVVKGKISGLLNNKQTVSQNYFSVCDLIKEHGFDTCQEVQYWAVADMTDGSEAKVVSFTLDRATIEGVADGSILENQLCDHVSDLYVHPSLQE